MKEFKHISEVPENTWVRIFTKSGIPLGSGRAESLSMYNYGYKIFMKSSSGRWFQSWESEARNLNGRNIGYCLTHVKPIIDNAGLSSVYWLEDYAGY